MKFLYKIKLKKQEKKYLKILKKDLKKTYKKEKINCKLEKNKIKNNKDLSSNEKIQELKKIDINLKNIKLDNKFQIEQQKNRLLESEPTKMGYFIKKHKFITFIICLFVIIFTTIGFINYKNSKPNYSNEYFSFKYNKDVIFIDDYTSIANMWVISTGGGIYEPTLILIGYTNYGTNLNVYQPLKNLQDEFGGEKSKVIKKVTDNFASEEYLLTLDNLSYKILSKSYKKDSKILTIMYINAGDLTKQQQTYLYQVYDTIKLK